MGTTVDGLPYPEGTDLVMDGDDAIQALAEALGGRTTVTLTGSARVLQAATAISSYPSGWSIQSLSNTEGTAGGWPRPGEYWSVVTCRTGSDGGYQYLIRTSPSATEALFRVRSTGAWTPWAGFGGPYATAAGIVSFGTVPSGSGKSVNVTLPVNQFSQAPILQASAISGTPQGRNASTSPGSASSFVCYFGNSGSADVTGAQAYWTATQMKSTSAPGLLLTADEPDATVTCPTEGCENQGIAIPITTHWTDDDGTEHTSDGAECGVCGTVLTPAELEE